MKTKRYRVHLRPDPSKIDKNKSAEDIVRELKKFLPPPSNYRERSLEVHGFICAKCGREFDHKNKHLLTIHHKDGNHQNNPPDGSNWENLCVYCHEDEHSRGLLGDYLREEK
ncbi:MAG: YajD family HNH nuclease [Pseudomonadota bacterium]